MKFEPNRSGLESQLYHLLTLRLWKNKCLSSWSLKPRLWSEGNDSTWTVWWESADAVLKYQVCCLVCSGCSVVVFAIVPGVPDLACGLVGWTTKDPVRLGLCSKAHRIAAWWPRLWQPREGPPPVEGVFLTYHIGNWTNLRCKYRWSLKKNQVILQCSLHRLKIFSEESVPLFGPPLPSPPVFTDHQEFRDFLLVKRSEERRVGKECRSRWSPYH